MPASKWATVTWWPMVYLSFYLFYVSIELQKYEKEKGIIRAVFRVWQIGAQWYSLRPCLAMASNMPKLSVIFHARACFLVIPLFFSAPFVCHSITFYYTSKSDVWHFLLASMATQCECLLSFHPHSIHVFYSLLLSNTPGMCVCFCEAPLHTLLLFTFIKFSSQLLDDLLNILQLESFKELLESINALFCTEAQVWYFYQNVLIQHKYFISCVWFLPLLSKIASRTKRHWICVV